MSLHLIKLCVGIDSVSHLAEVQARRLEAARRRGGSGGACPFSRRGQTVAATAEGSNGYHQL